jgi:hypothetical protein
MSYHDGCVATVAGHRLVGERVCANGGGVGEEPGMVSLCSRRMGAAYVGVTTLCV